MLKLPEEPRMCAVTYQVHVEGLTYPSSQHRNCDLLQDLKKVVFDA